MLAEKGAGSSGIVIKGRAGLGSANKLGSAALICGSMSTGAWLCPQVLLLTPCCLKPLFSLCQMCARPGRPSICVASRPTLHCPPHLSSLTLQGLLSPSSLENLTGLTELHKASEAALEAWASSDEEEEEGGQAGEYGSMGGGPATGVAAAEGGSGVGAVGGEADWEEL